MSTERLVEGLAKQIGRRNFLVKLGAGTAGGLLALMGLAQPVAAAHPFKCCNLCLPNGTGDCSGYYHCVWCWVCDYREWWGGTTRWRCCEGYGENTLSCGCCACNYVACSWAEQI